MRREDESDFLIKLCKLSGKLLKVCFSLSSLFMWVIIYNLHSENQITEGLKGHCKDIEYLLRFTCLTGVDGLMIAFERGVLRQDFLVELCIM